MPAQSGALSLVPPTNCNLLAEITKTGELAGSAFSDTSGIARKGPAMVPGVGEFAEVLAARFPCWAVVAVFR